MMLTSAQKFTEMSPGTSPESRSRLHWLSVVTHLDPRFGGLSAVVPQLSNEIATRKDIRVDVAAFCSPGELYSLDSYPRLSISEWPASRRRWFTDRSLKAKFASVMGQVSGLHLHGLWEQSTQVGANFARNHGVPYVVSAHGMLEPWALKQKALKKKIYGALVERPLLERAACLHALTVAEAEDYRRFGCTAPIAVIPNGVRLPLKVTSDLFLGQHRFLEGKRIVLFLGRIHAKKGLDVLVRAWKQVAQEHPQAVLVLAGPDFADTRARIMALVAEQGLEDRVLFTGMLRGELKWSALAAAESFVLPSFSEGLSVSVLEAMGVGLPVIISRQCNLHEVAQLGAGWEIRAEQVPLAGALGEMLRNSPAANREIGARGRAFVRDHYNWAIVAEQMAELYRWVTRGGAAPASLYRSEDVPGAYQR